MVAMTSVASYGGDDISANKYFGDLPSRIYIALVVLADNTIKSNQVTSSPQFIQQVMSPADT